jgi:hypothetical protein
MNEHDEPEVYGLTSVNVPFVNGVPGEGGPSFDRSAATIPV